MASSRTFPLLFLLLSLIRGGASTLGYALLPQHLLAQHNHTSWNNHTRAPPQLNRTSFARCLSAAGAFSPSELPDLRLMRSAHDLKVDDGLLMYLSLYAGQRFPKINETWQQPAYLRGGGEPHRVPRDLAPPARQHHGQPLSAALISGRRGRVQRQSRRRGGSSIIER